VNDARGTFFCFGCSASGGHLQPRPEVVGVDFMGALRWLEGADLPFVDQSRRQPVSGGR
jgi:DNA primase